MNDNSLCFMSLSSSNKEGEISLHEINEKDPANPENLIQRDRKLTKKLLYNINERKGSILKRVSEIDAEALNVFQRNDIKHKTVAFSNFQNKTYDKRDTIERLKQDFFTNSIHNLKVNDNQNNEIHNYSIEHIQSEEDSSYDIEKIPDLLRTSKSKERFTYIDSGQNQGNYQFYTIKELEEKVECNSAVFEDSKTVATKSFIFTNLFNEDEESNSSLGFFPDESRQEEEGNHKFHHDKKDNKKERELMKQRETKRRNYQYFQDFFHSTINPTQEEINNNIEENPKLKQEVTEIPNLFRQHTKILHKRKPDFLKIIEMDAIEKVFYDYDINPDKYPLKSLRKYTLLFFRYSQKYAKKTVSSKIFKIFSLIIIFSNCVTYTLLRNQKGNYVTYIDEIKRMEFAFFIFYLLEMILKLLAQGLIILKNSYFRNGWNILDFLVIIGLVLSYTDIFPSFDFSILRSLRLLGPLRTIASFRRFQIILSAFFSSLPLFMDALLILLFSYSIYAIMGLQLFSGILKFRCIDIGTGLQTLDELCGNLSCPNKSICIKTLKSINNDVINFDNVFSCFLQVLFIITLDSWTVIMYSIQKSFTNYVWIYFISLVIFGSYIMNNLLLAVIKVKFTEAQNNLLNGKDVTPLQIEQDERKFYDFLSIKREGYWLKKRETLKPNEQIPNETGKNETFSNMKIPLPLLNLKFADMGESSPLSKFSSNRLRSKKSKNSVVSPIQRRFSGEGKLIPKINKTSIFSLISPSHKLSSNYSFKNASFNSDENQQKQINFQEKLFRHLKDLTTEKLKKGLLNFFNYSKLRKKRRQSKIFANLKPKYLKLYVDSEKKYDSLSENDVLMKTELQNQVSKLENQLNEIKTKKFPLKYTLKETNSLFDVLKKIYSKQNLKSNDHVTESNELLKYFQQRSITKTNRSTPKNILKPLTEKINLFSKVKSFNQKTPENANNVNFTIKIKNKKDKKHKTKNFSLKSMKKSLENLSINKNRNRESIDKDEKLMKMINQKNKDAFSHIINLVKAPIDNFEKKNSNIEENEDKEENDSMNLDMIKEYLRIRKQDMASKVVHSYVWSGQDVLRDSYSMLLFAKIFQSLNQNLLEKYILELKGKFFCMKKILRTVLENVFYQNLFLVLILSYILLSALEGGISDSDLFLANFIFVIIFFLDFCMKVFCIGLQEFCRDSINTLELIILNCSILEIILIEINFANIFRYIRFLAAVKILRIARLFKNIEFFHFMIITILKTIAPCLYLIILLFLFNYVYSLIGMQLYGGILDQNDSRYSQNNFDTFWVAFLTVFNLITLDNWMDTLTLTFCSSAGKIISCLYIISWIIFGNFILLNILLAIILDGFTENLENEHHKHLVDEEQIEAEQEDLKNKILSDQEFTIFLPKDARETFMEELTKYYVKNLRQNPKEQDKDTQIIADLIMETQKRKDKNNEKTKEINDIPCLNSLYILYKSNYLRKKAIEIIFNENFNLAMVFIVGFSCLIMIGETYVDKNTTSNFDRSVIVAIKVLNSVCLTIFSIEMILKIISFGFFLDRKSYLRNKWNVLDSLIAFSYFIDLFSYETPYSELSITNLIRTIRVLRPLRFISSISNLNLLVSALLESSSAIINFLLLLVSIWLTYGVLGIILFRDRFGYCINKLQFNIGIDACGKDNWVTHPFNFDNMSNALLTLFVLSTIDGWNDIMSIAANSDLSKNGPSEFNNQYSAYAYFISFIFIGTLFLTNILIGIIFYNFTISSRRTKHKFLTESQLSWLHLHKSIILAEPHFLYKKPPSGTFQLHVYYFIRTKYFRYFIHICLILNFVVLAMPFEGNYYNYAEILNIFQLCFNGILIIEAFLKIFALGYFPYIYSSWNKFEFFIMFTAAADFLIQAYFYIPLRYFKMGNQLVKGLRILRVLRLVKLIKQKKGVERLIRTLIVSLPMVFNIFFLLLVVYFIFGMIGCHYFGDISEGNIINRYINFKNLAYSIMTLIKVSTADDWTSIMLDVMRKKTEWAALFFIVFYILTSYLLINLFILVLIRQFENYYLNPENPVHSFNDYLEKFRNIWSLFTVKEEGTKIKQKQIVNFFKSLKPPLGFSKDEEIDTILKEVAFMKLYIDHQGYIYFNELLFSTLKRTYRSQIEPGKNELAKKEIRHFEETTRLKLNIKKKSQKRDAIKKLSLNTMNYLKHIVKNVRVYNPLPNYFYSKMVFYTWRYYTNVTFDKLLMWSTENKAYFESSGSDEEDHKIKIKPIKNPNPSMNFEKDQKFDFLIQNFIRPIEKIPNIIVTKMIVK